MKTRYLYAVLSIGMSTAFISLGLDKKKETQITQKASKEGVTISVGFNKSDFKLEPVILNLEITNATKDDVWTGEIFEGLEITVLEEMKNNMEAFKIVDGNRVRIGPELGNAIHEEISLTLYGNQLKNNQEPRKIKISPGKKHLYNVNLSRIFHLLRAADYLISCKVNYTLGNQELQNTVEINDMRIKVVE